MAPPLPTNRPGQKPAYSPPVSSEPVQFSSLSDLTKGKAQQPAGGSKFAYKPDPSRAGYQENAKWGSGGEYDTSRRMPPAPSNYGKSAQPPPTREPGTYSSTSTSSTQPASGVGSYLPQGAQGYANTASSYASAGLGKAKDGLDSIFNTQNRDAAASGLGKAAAGGAKLLGQGAWRLGKFAANPSGK